MKIVILLYQGFTAMDVVGAYEVLCRLPEAQVIFAGKQAGLVDSEYPSMKMIASHRLEEIQNADILLVPGSTFAFTKIAQDQEVRQYLQRIHETTQWTVSVCTGSIILGAAGILKGKEATTHWALLDKLHEFGAVPKAERYVQQGKLITAAGVSAGTDMALFLTSLIAGKEYAEMLQLVTEYYPKPPLAAAELSDVSDQTKSSATAFLRKEIAKMAAEFSAAN
jgi:transcriptional regulator GlxA family with amidase domain